MKKLTCVCTTVLQPVILPLPFLIFPFLLFVFPHQSWAIFQPPALSFNHNHWCRYLMSSLHPGKHRPWDISCVISLNDLAPFCLFHHLHKSCRKPVSVCVSVCKLFHLPDSAADTSTCWAQTCSVCRYGHSAIAAWQGKLELTEAISDWEGQFGHCVSRRPVTFILFIMQVCICVRTGGLVIQTCKSL